MKLITEIERIEREWALSTKLKILHDDMQVIFAYPLFGPSNYYDNRKKILEYDLKIPSGDQIASLLYSAYCSELRDEKGFKDIKEIMKAHSLTNVYSKNLWTSDGVYVYREEIEEETDRLNIVSYLEDKLIGGIKLPKGIIFSRHEKIRFAPRDSYKLEFNSSDELQENGFIIANYGVDGAKKLAKISEKSSIKLFVDGLKINHGEDYWRCVSNIRIRNGSLYINGEMDVVGRVGYSIGILK